MPRGKSGKKNNTPEEEPEGELTCAENKDEGESSPDEYEFLSKDQVLWFRNIIRAQGKDILREMFQEKCRKLNEEHELLKKWVKTENEDLLKMITELKEDNKEKQRRIERLEYENRQKDKTIRELNTKYDELEQRGYDKEVQLVGLPESDSDDGDLKKILKLSKDKMGLKLKTTDIEGIHRLGKKSDNKSRDVIISFKERKARKAFYEQRKKTSQSKEVSRNIYVNDHLTDFRKGLFYRARQLVKHKRLYMAWTQSGNVLVRKEENGKITQVRKYEDLNSMIDEPQLSYYQSSEGLPSSNQEDIISHLSDYDY